MCRPGTPRQLTIPPGAGGEAPQRGEAGIGRAWAMEGVEARPGAMTTGTAHPSDSDRRHCQAEWQSQFLQGHSRQCRLCPGWCERSSWLQQLLWQQQRRLRWWQRRSQRGSRMGLLLLQLGGWLRYGQRLTLLGDGLLRIQVYHHCQGLRRPGQKALIASTVAACPRSGQARQRPPRPARSHQSVQTKTLLLHLHLLRPPTCRIWNPLDVGQGRPGCLHGWQSRCQSSHL